VLTILVHCGLTCAQDAYPPLLMSLFLLCLLQAAAVEFEKQGAEVVTFDTSKPETFELALAGLYGLFVVTAIGEDLQVISKIVETANKAGVQHYIWSTGDSTAPFFDSVSDPPPKVYGSYVPVMDSKQPIDAVFSNDKTTFLHAALYLENMYTLGAVQKGVYCNNLGDAKIPIMSCEDIGKSAYCVFKARQSYMGKHVYLAGDSLTSADLMAIVSQETGKDYKFVNVPREVYASFYPGAEVMANMHEYFKRNEEAFNKQHNREATLQVCPDVVDARAWVKAHVNELLAVGPVDEEKA
jgi:uncharacterized protein YbjT (DUF2867 family)